MNHSRRSLGGAERRVAPGGAGSSPAVSATSKKVLRRMLRDRDRRLHEYDACRAHRLLHLLLPWSLGDYRRLDAERREIRHRLKAHTRADGIT